MLLDRVQISGYKRLLNASAYFGRKTIALVGPNEAGKSTVLSALGLFNNTEPVPETSFSRADRERPRDPDEDVVVLSFALTPEHLKQLDTLPLVSKPHSYRRHKKVSGAVKYSFEPAPEFDQSVRRLSVSGWGVLRQSLDDEASDLAQDSPEVSSQLTQDLGEATEYFENGGRIDDSIWDRLWPIANRLAETKGAKAPLKTATSEFRKFLEFGRASANVTVIVRNALSIEEPRFLLFGSAQRAILPEYELGAEVTEQSTALANLLAVAGVTLGQLRRYPDDAPYVESLVDSANERLSAFFRATWSQEGVTVGIKVDSTTLRVFVKDTTESSVGWMNVSDRSDGLRMFVALATFLSSRITKVPPILLIDEAEQHLHLNAQADLVRMLQGLDQIEQVIYTTHSPGCLPADIGNGVRFVEPIDGGVSRLRHDFWSIESNGHVGFNPLLMVMGAGAAAFSGLRRALIVEGASDMLLLPTLIRLATGRSELDYQIAPGISVTGKSEFSTFDTVAGRVAFVVDGDQAGGRWKSDLLASGIPVKRIRVLGEDIAIEDLLDRSFYFDTLAELTGIERSKFEAIAAGGTLKSNVESWAKAHRHRIPGSIAVTEFILGNHESRARRIVLDSSRKKSLTQLHKWAEIALAL